jgi:aryl-alcohol dehydrogenase-like predicted oxidoreductase
MSDNSRRTFLGLGAVLGLAACHKPEGAHATLGAAKPAAPPEPAAPKFAPPPPLPGPVPKRQLGATGVEVSILGVGGYHLGQVSTFEEASRIVSEALDAGVNFFDNAWEYNDGKSEEYLGKALAGKRDRAFVMTKVCTHGRGRDVAMQQLEESLRRLATDHLDLWQVHECVYENDPEHHYAKDGVLRALEDAKRTGKVRFVGFTGHKHPKIHADMLSRGFPFDTVQLPLNVFDATFRSFERAILPQALAKRMGVIGMKSLGGHGKPILEGIVTIDEALRYALSVPGVSVTVSGIDSLAILRQNLAIAAAFSPMPEPERKALADRCAEFAGDGHFELYKTTTHFDAKVGREQHGYPSQEELPL